MTNLKLTGIDVLDRMAAAMGAEERLAFERGLLRGYLATRPGQRDLQRLWTLWCLRQQCPDIRVEHYDDHAVVSMHLGPCHATLSADGFLAIRRSFERSEAGSNYYQTWNWCKHPRVPLGASLQVAAELTEIASLDAVPGEVDG